MHEGVRVETVHQQPEGAEHGPRLGGRYGVQEGIQQIIYPPNADGGQAVIGDVVVGCQQHGRRLVEVLRRFQLEKL